ncbi:hypothetical protein BN8_03519 [Fibrisoma limi BUZ 3]|uniref:Uncharacterized protein n=1 Tax=Fibrisoma limi BUZ 3 TaxID=1185876 RepID=I2GKD2_9BACT|nr:hypothetical protein [Fibrisoma limi]CCH54357.1 hypothetical protein BN8_03519 [Fibrisoma limi BUZ 3]
MDLENEEFRLFAENAQRTQLKYLVIGGFAMYLNGLSRNTEDVDIWLEPTQENGGRFIETLIGMGYDESEIEVVRQLDFTEPQVFGLNNYIDILTYVHRKFDFNESYARSRSFQNDHGHTIYFLHLNDLREQKVVAHRMQDLRDIIMIDEFIAQQKQFGESEQ